MEDIINVLEQFAPVFSDRVWRHALTLLIGAILCRKERTVAAILRVMGLKNDPHFVNYHRVLSKARWSGLQAAKILLGLLVALVPVNLPVIIGVDDTIERRKEDKGQRLLSRPSAFYTEACYSLLRSEVAFHDADSTCSLEPALLGAALSDSIDAF